MALIDDLKSDLTKFEGYKAYVYDDANGTPITSGSTVIGNPTIGVGRCLNRNPLSASEIEVLLNNDCQNIMIMAQENFDWYGALTTLQRRGVLNMLFQLGFGGFCSFKDFIACMSKGDYKGAKAAALQSHWAQQTPERANEVLNMIAT